MLWFFKTDIFISYWTKQFTGGGQEETCDKKVGHGAKRVGNHCFKVYVVGKIYLFFVEK